METSQYFELFIEESREHIQTCNELLLLLEKDPENRAAINEIFRAAHTIKGMSATMGYTHIAELTHQMEDVLDGLRTGLIAVTEDVLDTLFSSVDRLEMLTETVASGDAESLGEPSDTDSYSSMEAVLPAKAAGPGHGFTKEERAKLAEAETKGLFAYEVAVSIREDCLMKTVRAYMVFEVLKEVGEVVTSIPPADQLGDEMSGEAFTAVLLSAHSAEQVKNRILAVAEIEKAEVWDMDIGSPEVQIVTGITDLPDSRQKTQNKTIRVNVSRLDKLMSLLEELVIEKGRLKVLANELEHPALSETVDHLAKISAEFQSSFLKMRMVKVDSVFNRFPKMVRQLSRELGKKVKFDITGADTELDRTIVEELGDPLVHLIRNALDHGIETPEAREAAGKEETGHLQLRAAYSGNRVVIEIEDDGNGISKQRILQKALDAGLVSGHQRDSLSDKEIYALMMTAGFSTSDTVSDISGRGVGLDVVKTAIEALGGTIMIQSEQGKGSVFTVELPLTLSIVAVMLVRLEEEVYAVPLSSISETRTVAASDVILAANRKAVEHRGQKIPFIDLREAFGCSSRAGQQEYDVLVIRYGEQLTALAVDAFIDQQEVVLKSLGHYLADVYAISGAAILGDGKVALVLECADFFQ